MTSISLDVPTDWRFNSRNCIRLGETSFNFYHQCCYTPWCYCLCAEGLASALGSSRRSIGWACSWKIQMVFTVLELSSTTGFSVMLLECDLWQASDNLSGVTDDTQSYLLLFQQSWWLQVEVASNISVIEMCCGLREEMRCGEDLACTVY